MKKSAIAGILMGLVVAAGCSRQDSDRARAQGRDAQENAQRQLDVTREKLRQGLNKADAQTREDLDKARDQLNNALDKSKSDAERARERLRENEKDRDDSHR